jgi:beta-glucanase (GH16 family)
MKHASLGCLTVALVALIFPVAHLAAAENSGSCTLRPVMMENFNEETAPNRRIESISSSRIGPARWTAHTPWSGDFGDAAFMDPDPGGPFSIKDGILSITATKSPEGKWTSGLLAAADATGAGTGTRYGYFEARMKMPPGPGTWPAFWLHSLKPVAGADGDVEIDVIEYYGHDPASYQAVVHAWYKDEAKSRGQNTKVEVPNNSLVDGFHTFGVDVSPQAIVFFRDGNRVWSQPTPPELDGPLYPLVNLALGSGWPIDQTPNPSTLLVDYIHVYGRDAGPPEGCPAGPPSAAH